MIMNISFGFIGALGLVVASGGAASANWEPSAYDGESGKAVRGCASAYSDNSWMCIVVRCESGRLALFIDYGEGDTGDLAILVGGKAHRFKAVPSGSAPYSERLSGNVPAFVSALKTGSNAMLRPNGHKLPSGYDRISLRGAGTAIDRLERSCG